MKRLSILLVIVLALVHLGLFVHDFKPAGALYGPNKSMMQAIDFSMRRNEAACVLDGVNPYDVWTKKIVKSPYYPYVEQGRVAPGFTEPINAYTPWEYVAAFPSALLEKQTAWHVHIALMLLSLAFLVWTAWHIGGAVSAIAALLFVIPINMDLNVGNYSLIITAATAGMLWSLDKGHRLLPIVLWAIAMFKPQMSVLLAIPLFLRRQWLVGIGTAALCLALSFVPACLCHVSIVDLLFQAPAACAHGFIGCALMPGPLLNALKPLCPATVWMGVAMACGVVLCIILSLRFKGSRSWFALAAPVLLCSISWTYLLQYSYVLMTPVAAVLAADMVRNRTPGRLLLGIPAILLWARFARGAEILTERFVPALLPLASFACQMSATVAFILTAIYLGRYSQTLIAATGESTNESVTGR